VALSYISAIQSSQKNKILVWDVVTSVNAGVWEEFGFRAILICYAMVSILFFNFLLNLVSGVVGVIPGVIVIALAFYLVSEEKEIIAGVLFALGVAISFVGLDWGIGMNSLLWFYRAVMIPIVNFVTFGQMESVFYGGHEPIFIFGALVANTWFRYIHKYQGIVGFVNSWFFGLVMLYAVVTYGLLVAVVLHILYDLEIAFIWYCHRCCIK
jgi:hypothetical protein